MKMFLLLFSNYYVNDIYHQDHLKGQKKECDMNDMNLQTLFRGSAKAARLTYVNEYLTELEPHVGYIILARDNLPKVIDLLDDLRVSHLTSAQVQFRISQAMGRTDREIAEETSQIVQSARESLTTKGYDYHIRPIAPDGRLVALYDARFGFSWREKSYLREPLYRSPFGQFLFARTHDESAHVRTVEEINARRAELLPLPRSSSWGETLKRVFGWR